ncbi:MAG: hypothetical protein NWR43_04550, partial [Alphaproteobacteria bacterium]|nr:hypothetical protein [Alphaproteobacteria bacterium]
AKSVVLERHLASSCPHKKDQEVECTNHINQRNHQKNKRHKQRRALYLKTLSEAEQEVEALRSIIRMKTNYLMSLLCPETLYIASFKSDYDIGNYFFIQNSFLINNQEFEMENVKCLDVIPKGSCYQFYILDSDSEIEETSESIESFSNQ